MTAMLVQTESNQVSLNCQGTAEFRSFRLQRYKKKVKSEE